MAFEGWKGLTPPPRWNRILTMDVGGATNNALEWAAICPETQSLVFYDEIVKITTDIRLLASMCKPKMSDPESGEYNFLFRAGDYENRIALDDMGRHGIKFTNAVKHNKNLSIQRLSGYLHPNPMRPYPHWHPKAGQLGAPLMFVMATCKELIKEIPLQKWKVGDGEIVKDVMDRSVRHDTVDCALYAARLLPAPATIPVPKRVQKEDTRSLQSKIYWEDVKRLEAAKSVHESRKKYNPAHQSGGLGWKL
jgi:hypothetical protein